MMCTVLWRSSPRKVYLILVIQDIMEFSYKTTLFLIPPVKKKDYVLAALLVKGKGTQVV